MPRSPKSAHFISLAVFLVITLVAWMATIGCSSSNSQNTKIRFVNASPNQASFNVLIDSTSVATGLANGGSSTSYLSAKTGSREIQMQDPNTSQNLIDKTLTLTAGTNTTFIAADYVGNLKSLVLTDDNSSPASGSFKLRVVNVAPNLNANVDVYIVTAGTDINTVSPAVNALSYPSASAYVSNTAGSYQVVFTLPGTKTIVATLPNDISGGASVAFTAGQVQTALVLNDVNGIPSTVQLGDVN